MAAVEEDGGGAGDEVIDADQAKIAVPLACH
jgi:hypothetical protein